MSRVLSITPWLLLPILATYPQETPKPAAPLNTVARFGIFEHTFTQQGIYQNPYREVTATARFTEPGGRERLIPLFWDGETQWKVRFSPDVVGEWRWSVSSSDRGLKDEKGSFNCVASTNRG